MKAMRNDRGEMVKNAHLRGFFSRICKCVRAGVCVLACGQASGPTWSNLYTTCSPHDGSANVYPSQRACTSISHPTLPRTRLLFHKVRPVFVFDGATPALKRSTHIARRRRREAQEVALRRTAEKLLVNRLKKQVRAQLKASEKLWVNLQQLNNQPPLCEVHLRPDQARTSSKEYIQGSGFHAHIYIL